MVYEKIFEVVDALNTNDKRTSNRKNVGVFCMLLLNKQIIVFFFFDRWRNLLDWPSLFIYVSRYIFQQESYFIEIGCHHFWQPSHKDINETNLNNTET